VHTSEGARSAARSSTSPPDGRSKRARTPPPSPSLASRCSMPPMLTSNRTARCQRHSASGLQTHPRRARSARSERRLGIFSGQLCRNRAASRFHASPRPSSAIRSEAHPYPAAQAEMVSCDDAISGGSCSISGASALGGMPDTSAPRPRRYRAVAPVVASVDGSHRRPCARSLAHSPHLVVDEKVERFDLLDRRLNLARIGDVQNHGRNTLIRMAKRLARGGVNTASVSPQSFLHQRAANTAFGE
jgi:hypothetical protein